MGTENARIDKYQYEVHQEIAHSLTRQITLLYLFDKDRNLLCTIAFLPDDAELERPKEVVGGHVSVQMHSSEFARLIDMLRNEKPIYFSWWREAQRVRITTSKEPVGEQELRKLFSFLYV